MPVTETPVFLRRSGRFCSSGQNPHSRKFGHIVNQHTRDFTDEVVCLWNPLLARPMPPRLNEIQRRLGILVQMVHHLPRINFNLESICKKVNEPKVQILNYFAVEHHYATVSSLFVIITNAFSLRANCHADAE